MSAAERDCLIRCCDVGLQFPALIEQKRSLKQLLTGFWRGSSAEPFWVLRGLNFEIRRGETVGLVGGNGAGKTTLCQLLAGIYEADEGVLESRARVAALLGLGIGFHGDLSGLDNIFRHGALLGLSRSALKSRAAAVLEYAEVTEFAAVPLKKWSTGMRARLAFALGLELEGDLLILDEVLAVGDQRFQARCEAAIRDHIERSGAVLIVSHNLEQLTSFCERAIWLEAGRIAKDGMSSAVCAEFRQFQASRT